MPAPLRLLMVEDDASFRKLALELLREGGMVFDIWEVATVSDAVAALRLDRYDAVLMDLTLPNGRGEAAVDRVLSARADLIPMIVITGDASSETQGRCLEKGVQEFLPKTAVTISSLRRCIENAIHRGKGLGHLIAVRGRMVAELQSGGVA